MTVLSLRPSNIHEINMVLDLLKRMNMAQMAKRRFPPLYKSGVVYRREFPREDWLTYTEVLRIGSGDCEDLAGIRAAELEMAGVPASPFVYRTRSGGLHAVVRNHRTGLVEDPSRKLGMGTNR